MLQIGAQKDACSWAVRKTPKLHGLQRVRRVDKHLAHICNQARMILVSKIGTMLHGRGYDGGWRESAEQSAGPGPRTAATQHRQWGGGARHTPSTQQLELVQLLFSGAL